MNVVNDNLKETSLNSSIIPTIGLPWIYRIVQLSKHILPNTGFRYQAELFHEKATISVTWVCDQENPSLNAGMLVSPCWMSKTICKEGQILIQTLNKVQKPTASINLFDTIPHKWVKNRELIKKAQEILRSLPEHYRYLLNAIFWEHTRFYRFLVVPYSLNTQSKFNNGLLRYTLHLVTTAINLLKEESTVSRELLTVAAFLQEAGIADKYTYKGQTKSFVLSSRSMLIDDAFTVLEWLTTAVERYQIELPTKDYINLVHAICADKSVNVPATHLISLNQEAKVISIAKKCTYIQHELATMESVSGSNIFQLTTIH